MNSLGAIATLIPQEAEVFDASVRDNLTFGADHPLTEINQAAHLSAFDSVAAARPEACIVASVHRMNLLCHFDRVVLTAQGRIVDQGSQAELAARQPAFRDMLRQQTPQQNAGQETTEATSQL